jgi:hypothetical protein
MVDPSNHHNHIVDGGGVAEARGCILMQLLTGGGSQVQDHAAFAWIRSATLPTDVS